MGEHSAVYNKPAIIFPIPQVKVFVTIKKSKINQSIIHSSYFNGTPNELPAYMDGLKLLIIKLEDNLNSKRIPLDITIKSEIPLGRGMGSSAATATAIIRGYFNFFEKPLNMNTLKTFTDIEENVTHGNPSGIDAETVSSMHPILFEAKQFSDFPSKLNGYLVIADTGISSNTRVAVSKVHDELANNKTKILQIIDHLGDLVENAKKTISSDDINGTGKIMNLAQQDLKQLKVSSKEIEKLIKISLQFGAVGAKLTGSGLGGCIIALTSKEHTAINIKNALLKNGAAHVWIQTLQELNN